MSQVSKLVKSARSKKKLSQRALAQLVDLDPSFISRVERGKVNVSLRHVPTLAKVLDLEADVLAKAIYDSLGKKVNYTQGMFRAIRNGALLREQALLGNSPVFERIPIVGGVLGRETMLQISDSGKPIGRNLEWFELPQLPHLLAVRVEDADFMPVFAPGDVLLIAPIVFQPGDPVLAKARGKGCRLGRIFFDEESLTLKGFNDKQKSVSIRRDNVAFVYKVVTHFIA